MPKKPPAPEDLMFKAFRKLEERKEQEKVSAQRAIELEKFKARQLAEIKKKKFQDNLIYSGLIIFLVSITIIINRARENGYFASKVSSSASGFNSNGEEIDCRLAENWKDSFCIDLRKQQTDEKWESMVMNKSGKERPFSVHGDKKPQ
jgi:hypothetical protein